MQDSEKQHAGKNARERAKHANLDKKYNLRLRQDYIESDYINGVYDKDGKRVMPPVPEQARDYLDKFYQETVNARFPSNARTKELRELLSDQKKIASKCRKARKEVPQSVEEEILKLKTEYKDESTKLGALYPDYDDQNALYIENNNRNDCLMNRSKAAKRLHEINHDTYNEAHDNAYYCVDSGENLVINQIDRKHRIKVIKKGEKE